jgi:hypothetical protein
LYSNQGNLLYQELLFVFFSRVYTTSLGLALARPR